MLNSLEGRYLLFRAGSGGCGKRKLVMINPGPDGYTIPWLRNDCLMGNAFTYIVPTQESISIEREHYQVVFHNSFYSLI